MRRISVILLWVVLFKSAPACGQLNFYFLPQVYSRQIDGLGTFQVQNLGRESLRGRVVITVQEASSRKEVVRISTPVAVFNPGVSLFPKTLYTASRFTFADNALARIVNQTRSFPPGAYTFCFSLVPVDKTDPDLFENCFEGEVQPLVPISLLTPSDGDTICTKRPLLSWQPPVPYHASMRFRLLITEKKNEGPMESMVKSLPLLLLDNIVSASLQYPATHPALQEGKTYYWQVVAYQDGVVVSTSEVWTFTVQCSEPAVPLSTDSYRELKYFVNGNYYVANYYLKFAFQNSFNVNKLSYTLHDLADGGKAVRHTPEIRIVPGLNKINLELTHLGLKAGNHYVLKVYPFNEQPIEVRFVYQEKEENF